jgi:peptidoglycan/LPS O-acetylase OafA/YrhL
MSSAHQTATANSPLAYRPDVDGLRTVAVLAVVIFHAFPALLPGGFVGVDVFFVISGFLITGIILRDIEQGQHTLRGFYARRIRRIFPALLLILAFAMGVGWIALTANEYKQLGKYAAGAAAFLNNFLFWKDADYFDNAAITKPLLHLWSLAIEEQFYLVWPLLLVLLVRVRSLLWPIAILMIASLAYSAYKVRIDITGDFYSPLTRFWELLLGSGLACLIQRRPDFAQQHKRWMGQAGLLLITLGLVLINETRAFPGWWALLPTVGAALVLWAGMQSASNRVLLAHPVMVWVGLISYPLYLWHWPLLSFARIFEGHTPSVAMRCGLVLASILFAWLTYVLIERPIRRSKPSRLIVSVLVLMMLGFLFGGYYINRNEGIKSRHYDKLNADPATMVVGAERSTYKRACGLEKQDKIAVEWCRHDNKLPKANAAVLGDSKGEALLFGLSRESGPQLSWIMMGPIQLQYGHSSGLAQIAMQRLLGDPEIKLVVLHNALRGFASLDKDTGFISQPVTSEHINKATAQYTTAIKSLQAAGKRVVFVIDNPTLPDPNSCISGQLTPYSLVNHFIYRKPSPYCNLAYSDHLKGTAAYQKFLAQLRSTNPQLIVIDPLPLLCDIPKNLCTFTENGKFLYSYGDHISDYASSKIARVVLEQVNSRK